MKTMVKVNLLALTGACLLALTACTQKTDVQQTESTTETETPSTLPKLLDLGAHKCIQCQKMAPILDELSKEYKGVFDVEFIDVWQPENQAKAEVYGIQSIPTQIFFDSKGKELWRHTGFISKEDIMNKWKELGFEFKTKSNVANPPNS